MLQKYTFFDGGEIEFENTRTVKELIEYAFEAFDYYEPLGMDKVTLFQAHHPDTDTGWFTTNVELTCAEEIKNPGELCFAYHMPGVFYFAEGGWGHHMPHLGNHPEIPNAVALEIRFEDFSHNIVINGDLCFNDILNTLQKTDYIPSKIKYIMVLHIGVIGENYSIDLSDRMLSLPLADFLEKIRDNSKKIQDKRGEFIYHEIFEIVW